MEIEIKTEEIKEIVLVDNSQFSYSIKQVEITNILGTTVAVLDEYFITNAAGESYKLYKTNEGNWYDMEDANPDGVNARLMQIKKAINSIISSK
jgi:hypothetical protein